MFNLRHASAQNVIERIFGVLKRQYRILLVALEYNFEVQRCLPCALAAVHNFIREHDDVIQAANEETFEADGGGGNAGNEELDDIPNEPSELRDSIAEAMWTEYTAILEARGDAGGDDDDNV